MLAALSRRDWPGNVRELENLIARILACEPDAPAIGVDALIRASAYTTELGPDSDANSARSLREQMEAVERNILARTLDAVFGNHSEAARRLRISRTTLIDRLKKHGLLPAGARGDGPQGSGGRACAVVPLSKSA